MFTAQRDLKKLKELYEKAEVRDCCIVLVLLVLLVSTQNDERRKGGGVWIPRLCCPLFGVGK